MTDQIKTIKVATPEISLLNLRQVLLGMSANLRQSNAHTKNRGEVSGGGKKPWRQKGTGRARVGSSRTPVWRGGGVVFGPTNERNYSQKINKQAGRQALHQALAMLAQNDRLLQANETPVVSKTKELLVWVAQLVSDGGKVVIVGEQFEDGLKQASRNIKMVSLVVAKDLNANQVANADTMIFLPSAWEVVAKRIKQAEVTNG